MVLPVDTSQPALARSTRAASMVSEFSLLGGRERSNFKASPLIEGIEFISKPIASSLIGVIIRSSAL